MNRSTRNAIDIMVSRVPRFRRNGATRETFAEALIARHEENGELGEDEIVATVAHCLSYFDGSPAFIAEHAPVISLTLEHARTLAELAPPAKSESGWRFATSTMMIDIEEVGCVFAQRKYGPVAIMGETSDDTNMLGGLMSGDSAIPLGGGCIGSSEDGVGALSRFLGNLAYFMEHPEDLPKHWRLEERHPSPAAERKRAKTEHRKPRHVPGTLWVLSATRNLSEMGRERDHSEPGERASDKSWKWGVRTWRSAHYRWQAYGPQWSKRRLVYIEGHDMGDPDAPLSVHAVRVG